jgi:Fe-S cluster assembly protein SufD
MATANSTFTEALEVAAAAPSPQLLGDLRLRGRDEFQALGLPSRRTEEWRFTRLKSIEEGSFESPLLTPPRVDVGPWRLPNSHLLVFVDGIFSPDASHKPDLPDGVAVSNLVVTATAGSDFVAKYLGSIAPVEDHPFAALNTALFSDGAAIHIPDGVELEKPIQLVFVSGSDGRAVLAAPRVLIVAGAGSRATVVENHVGDGGASLSCPVDEIVLGKDAELSHIVIQEEDADASHLAVRQIRLAERSRYDAQSVSLGGALARTDIGVALEGEKAVASLDGLYLTDGSQQADTHLRVRHAVANCESHQLYKGILGGSSRAVFNGRIMVDQDAQKTDANQANRNLLLSDAAVVNSNPQLEIFADDVRCTHGSTIGRLDEDAIFYLRARGIGAEDARRLLVEAFAGEVLDRIPIEEIRDRLVDAVAHRLTRIAGSEDPS